MIQAFPMSNCLNASTVLAIHLAFDPGQLPRHDGLLNGKEYNIYKTRDSSQTAYPYPVLVHKLCDIQLPI